MRFCFEIMKEHTGFIVFGPKESIRYSLCAEVYYTPTPEQVKNIKEMFGWDFVTIEEMNRILNEHNEQSS